MLMEATTKDIFHVDTCMIRYPILHVVKSILSFVVREDETLDYVRKI